MDPSPTASTKSIENGRHAPFLGLDGKEYGLSEPLSRRIERVDEAIGAMLERLGLSEVAQAGRALYQPKSIDETPNDQAILAQIPALKDPEFVTQLARAFTVLFQLINLCEQLEIVRSNRARGISRKESLYSSMQILKESGILEADAASAIESLEIVPTFTAHPTEARRRPVLDKLLAIARVLSRLESSAPLSEGLEGTEVHQEELERILTALWQTDELTESQLTPAEELENALYFIESSVLHVVPRLQDDLTRAFRHHYPGQASIPPIKLRYASWVGGDRDGNPNVTAKITELALARHRKLAASLGGLMIEVGKSLTQTVRLVKPTPEITELAQQLKVSHEGFYYQNLLFAIADEYKSHPQNVETILEQLELVKQCFQVRGVGNIADTGPLSHLITQLRQFGSFGLALDIRQHSEKHEAAVDDLLRLAKVTADYKSLGENERLDVLHRELMNPRPLASNRARCLAITTEVLSAIEAMKEGQALAGERSCNTYIVSMTHQVSDLLEVLLLAKECGLWIGDETPQSALDVVPLFETIEDLEGARDFLDQIYQDPVYKLQIRARGNFQEVMLGYSDSSKDGGYLAANWALHQGQSAIAEVTKKHGIELRLFHGRGGTVGRGGGRAGKAIVNQPRGSFSGRIRFTEQGEVISFRYGLRPIAHRHLEQIVSASLMAKLKKQVTNVNPEWAKAMDGLAKHSSEWYRDLVYNSDGFWEFYTRCTPIEYIALLPIASRPVFRPGKALKSLEDLRAIPWNFAWVQSRYVAPGWYGVGYAIEKFCAESEENLQTLQEMARDWGFFQTVLENAQLELIRAHIPTASAYAQRAAGNPAAGQLHRLLAEEHKRTARAILNVTGQKEILEKSVMVKRTVELRNPAVVPLGIMQRLVMNVWEELDPAEHSGPWRKAMLQTIAGIAAAMQSTG